MLGLGTGALIMPLVAQYLIARVGWRLTFGIVGAAILTVTVPVVSMFLKERPELMGLRPDGSPYAVTMSPKSDADLGLSWHQAWTAPTFWLLFCAFVFVSASVQACFTHSAAILADRGTPVQVAALATSLFGAGLLVGRTGSGYLLDRFFAPRVAAVIFGCAAFGIGLLQIVRSQELAFAAVFFIGLGLGAEVDIMAYLTTRYFGLRSFGAIYSVTFAGFGLAGGLGAYLMGAAFDATGSYELALALFCIATSIGAVLMMRLGPYRYQIRAFGGEQLPMFQPES
jgi:predicted MFS family arabinose efflux permease